MTARRNKLVFIVVSAVLLVLIAVCSGPRIVAELRGIRDLRLYSDMSFLNAAIREELQRYFKKEGRYPGSLDDLTQSILENFFQAKEPAKPRELELLGRFRYSSNMDNYMVTWSVKLRGRVNTYKEYGENGALVNRELYVDGKLRDEQSEEEWK